jgi:hypothetical protein
MRSLTKGSNNLLAYWLSASAAHLPNLKIELTASLPGFKFKDALTKNEERRTRKVIEQTRAVIDRAST